MKLKSHDSAVKIEHAADMKLEKQNTTLNKIGGKVQVAAEYTLASERTMRKPKEESEETAAEILNTPQSIYLKNRDRVSKEKLSDNTSISKLNAKDIGKGILSSATNATLTQLGSNDENIKKTTDKAKSLEKIPENVRRAKRISKQTAKYTKQTAKASAKAIEATGKITANVGKVMAKATAALGPIALVVIAVLAILIIVIVMVSSMYEYERQSSGGGQDIVAVAQSQIGNKGGQPYWSWYGFSNRVSWCACFVSWCANECGYIESGTIPKFSLVGDGVDWFRSKNQWQGNDYKPEPGDIIFFSWGGSGSQDHVGIVEKTEGTTVYAIEGNSGDECKRNKYPVGSSNIYGYGTPDYPATAAIGGSGGNAIQNKIVKYATNGNWYGCVPGYCEAWVAAVYRIATGEGSGHCCAKASRDAWATKEGDIPVGACIYSSDKYKSKVICSCGRNAGHVGIYVGNNKVASMVSGGPKVMSLSSWEAQFGYGGWSWRGRKID